MSNRSLTGYDNEDAVSEEPDEEVYLYHAEEGGAGRLVCASCNPSGARPVGVEYAKINDGLVGGDRVWEDESTWIAANIPGWTPYALDHALYQSRYLSNSGRLFFNTNDALLAQDINSNQDVYELEPPGAGDCTSASSSFIASSNGCLSLISSGRAAGESAFLDASESGNDVFFLTAEQLVKKDVDTALDVYDAHVCSAEAPCFAEEATPPPCTTAESCRAAVAPQPSIFGAPSSATFSGEGNLAAPLVTKPTTAKKPTRAQQLAKALSSCRSKYKRQKKRRASCEAQAKKRYGPPARKKSKKKPKKQAKK
jgi:hypothetical protein